MERYFNQQKEGNQMKKIRWVITRKTDTEIYFIGFCQFLI